MIGAGRVGKVHSQFHYPPRPRRARSSPWSTRSPRSCKATAGEFGIEARFDSLEEALEKAAFDAVVITTPTFTHKHLALLAAENGKHVFLEKPMALNLAECDADHGRDPPAPGVLLQLGFMRRFDPEFAAAAKRIEAGEIGRPMMIKSLTHGPGLPPAWARDLRTSNGMLAEVNSHDWDTVRWLMGSNYERVYTEVANFKGAANEVDTPNFYDNVAGQHPLRERRAGQHLRASARAATATTPGWRSSARRASCRSASCRARRWWSAPTATRA